MQSAIKAQQQLDLPTELMKTALTAIAAVLIAAPAYAQRWESVRTGEYVLQLPDGAVIIDCKAWEWRRIGQPSTVTRIAKGHPAYVVCDVNEGGKR